MLISELFVGDFMRWATKDGAHESKPLQVPGEHRKTAGNSWLFIKPPPWKVAETDWGLRVLIIIISYYFYMLEN